MGFKVSTSRSAGESEVVEFEVGGRLRGSGGLQGGGAVTEKSLEVETSGPTGWSLRSRNHFS